MNTSLVRHWTRWTEYVVVGTFFGGALAIWIAASAVSHGTTMTFLPAAAAAIAIAGVAGLVEGGAVGIAQSLAFRDALPRVPAVPWVLATAVATAVAWGAVMALNLAMVEREVTFTTMAVVFVAGGATLGAMLGAMQWLIVRGRDAAMWIGANAVAWVVGSGIAVSIASLVGPASGAEEVLAAMFAIAMLTGGAVGAITGLAFLRELRRRAA